MFIASISTYSVAHINTHAPMIIYIFSTDNIIKIIIATINNNTIYYAYMHTYTNDDFKNSFHITRIIMKHEIYIL
jgi:hypothetical protein